jgi:asparagine synthase (glutamine-hydrolysing)
MIAAVWHPRGIAAARVLLARLGEGPPRDAKEVGETVLAAWGRGEIDHERGVAYTYRRDVHWPSAPARPFTWEDSKRLRGTYALIGTCDSGTGLVLARGALGGRPLFFADAEDGAIIASSRLAPLVKAIDAHEINADRLASLTVFTVSPEPRATPFTRISRVAVCETLKMGRAGFESARRDTPTLGDLRGVSTEALAEQLWVEIRASVRRAMQGHERVAVSAGGGIDSSGLLAAAIAEARGATPKDVLAVAIDFAADGDDRPYMKDLCRDLGITPLRLSPRDAHPWFTKSLVLDAAPFPGATGQIELLIGRLLRDEGIEAILSGAGGDEIFVGDMRALALEARKRPLFAFRAAARMRDPWGMTTAARVSAFVARPLVRPLVPGWMLRARRALADARYYRWAGPRLRRVLARCREAPHPPIPETSQERYAQFANTSILADYADGRGQLEAATGCIRLEPFTDDLLLGFLAQIPVTTLLDGNWHRGLLRRAMRGHVPETICQRVDKSAWEPAIAESANGRVDLLEDLARAPHLAEMEIVDPKLFRSVYETVRRAPAAPDVGEPWNLLWGVAATEAFARSVAQRAPS